MCRTIDLVPGDWDVDEIRRLHGQWWDAHHGTDVPMMAECLAGERAVVFDLNGHPYFGLADMRALWAHRERQLSVVERPERWEITVTIDGNIAWLTCEGAIRVLPIFDGGGSDLGELRDGRDAAAVGFRETAVFRRDDGIGNPRWRIWHSHCSPSAPVAEARPGRADTAADRARTDEWNADPWTVIHER